MTKPIEQLLASVPYFSDLDDEELGSVARAGHEESYEPGAVIFREGDEGDVLYVVLEGAVEIFRVTPEGERIPVIAQREGSFFGELALFDRAPRSACAASVTETRLFLLGRDDFFELLAKDRRMLGEVLIGISDKLRSASRKLFESMLQTEVDRAKSEIDRHRAISEMVAGVAHEINTPLGIVNSAASVVTETLTPDVIEQMARSDDDLDTLESVADACRLIQSNIERANRLIQSFKNLSAHHASEVLEEADLVELTTEVLDMFRIKAKRAGIDVSLVNELSDKRLWAGYPGHYTQILLNLLTNVERYAYPDGQGGAVVVRLAVAPTSGRPRFEVSVRDEGVGIPEADQERIFDAFFTTGRGRGGTGLGLSIVHNLLTHSLMGDIRVESTPGAGTEFTLRFPMMLSPESRRPPSS